MKIAFAVVLAVHGLIHVMGFLKAFGTALPQLTLPISRPMGVLWLVAAVLLLFADATLFAAPRWFWLAGGLGLVASQLAIVGSWGDARFGTVANVVLLIGVVLAAFSWGPFGLRAEYERLVSEIGDQWGDKARPISEADLASLPAPVQRYLRFAGVVGKPRARAVHVRLIGRIRGAADEPWMSFVADQRSTFDPPRRYFWMDATRGGLPVDVLHAFGADGATMRVRLLSLIPMVDQSGPALTRAETVTLLNEMAIYAPSTLVSSSITWRAIDDRTAEATFSNGAHTIRGVLVVDGEGALVDFWSDDRPALAADGVTLVPQRWSTPLRDYRTQGAFRLATRGEGRYAPPSGDYAYLELDSIEVTSELPQVAPRVPGDR